MHEIEFLAKGYVPEREEITLPENGDYDAGNPISVQMHDGSYVRLKKVDERSHDPRNRGEAIQLLEQAQLNQTFITGLLYYEEPRLTIQDALHMTPTPLVDLPDEKLRPSRETFEKMLNGYRV